VFIEDVAVLQGRLSWCKHHLAEFIAISASHATTMGHIKRGDLDAAMVLVPPPVVLEGMSQQMQPLLDKQSGQRRPTLLGSLKFVCWMSAYESTTPANKRKTISEQQLTPLFVVEVASNLREKRKRGPRMLTESAIEAFAIKLLERQGFTYVHGPALAPEGEQAERTHYGEVMLGGRLAQAARRINHRLPTEVVDLAVKEVLRAGSPELFAANESFHRWLTEGVPVSRQKDGDERGERVWLIDFDQPERNEFLVVKACKEDPETGQITISTVKKLAAYHQYYAVNAAVASTLRASDLGSGHAVRENPASYGVPGVSSQPKGDKKAGVVWHTQGSGKSLSMVFYTGKIVQVKVFSLVRTKAGTFRQPQATTPSNLAGLPARLAKLVSGPHPLGIKMTLEGLLQPPFANATVTPSTADRCWQSPSPSSGCTW
jgi:hypothetical protein